MTESNRFTAVAALLKAHTCAQTNYSGALPS